MKLTMTYRSKDSIAPVGIEMALLRWAFHSCSVIQSHLSVLKFEGVNAKEFNEPDSIAPVGIEMYVEKLLTALQIKIQSHLSVLKLGYNGRRHFRS